MGVGVGLGVGLELGLGLGVGCDILGTALRGLSACGLGDATRLGEPLLLGHARLPGGRLLPRRLGRTRCHHHRRIPHGLLRRAWLGVGLGSGSGLGLGLGVSHGLLRRAWVGVGLGSGLGLGLGLG